MSRSGCKRLAARAHCWLRAPGRDAALWVLRHGHRLPAACGMRAGSQGQLEWYRAELLGPANSWGADAAEGADAAAGAANPRGPLSPHTRWHGGWALPAGPQLNRRELLVGAREGTVSQEVETEAQRGAVLAPSPPVL